MFTNQTEGDYNEVFKAKFETVYNLDKVTRDKCEELDYFVVFSSMAGGLGNPGQTNYCMASSAVDILCEKRKLAGFPALSVQFGPIGEVGKMENWEQDKRVIL